MWTEVISNILSFESLIALVIGVVGGMVIGALPGLNATMAISLLIPITYSMSPYAAFIMMMAVYTSAFYGGSLTAILIHTPGTPSSAATAGDGYALTQQGRGLEAMGMSTVASAFGGLMSGIALLTLAPLLGRLTLFFSAPEYFLIVILGLSIIGGLGTGSMVKGFLMGVFGLLLGTVGTDGITGQLRFTFGMDGLYCEYSHGTDWSSYLSAGCQNYQSQRRNFDSGHCSSLNDRLLRDQQQNFRRLYDALLWTGGVCRTQAESAYCSDYSGTAARIHGRIRV